MHDPHEVDDFSDPISPKLFDVKLKPVVTALDETLREFPKQSAPAPETAPDTRPKLFFADVADTLRPFRKRLIKELSELARLLDAIPPPLECDPYDQAVAQVLEQADLSIYLLDQCVVPEWRRQKLARTHICHNVDQSLVPTTIHRNLQKKSQAGRYKRSYAKREFFGFAVITVSAYTPGICRITFDSFGNTEHS